MAFHFAQRPYVWVEDDVNADGRIDVLDAILVMGNWGGTIQP